MNHLTKPKFHMKELFRTNDVLHQLEDIVLAFDDGRITTIEDYRNQLFLLAERYDAPLLPPQQKAVIALIDSVRKSISGYDATRRIAPPIAEKIHNIIEASPDAECLINRHKKYLITRSCDEADFVRIFGERISMATSFDEVEPLMQAAINAEFDFHCVSENNVLLIGENDEMLLDTSDFSYTVLRGTRDDSMPYPREKSE